MNTNEQSPEANQEANQEAKDILELRLESPQGRNPKMEEPNSERREEEPAGREGEKMVISDSLRPKINSHEVGAKIREGLSSRGPETVGYRDAVAGYDQSIALLRQRGAEMRKPEDAETRRRREKRERAQAMIRSIGRGLSAISNLYYTSKGAPAMDLKTGYPEIERLLREEKAERDQDEAAYYNNLLKIADMEQARARTLQDMKDKELQRQQASEAQKLRAEEHAWERDLHPYKLQAEKAKSRKSEADAFTSETGAEYAPLLAEAKLDTERMRSRAQRNAGDASRAQAELNRTKAQTIKRDSEGRIRAWDRRGNAHYFKTEEEAVIFAKQEGTLGEYEVEKQTESTKSDGRKKTETSTKTKETKTYPTPPSKGKGYGEEKKGKGY